MSSKRSIVNLLWLLPLNFRIGNADFTCLSAARNVKNRTLSYLLVNDSIHDISQSSLFIVGQLFSNAKAYQCAGKMYKIFSAAEVCGNVGILRGTEHLSLLWPSFL